MTELHAALKALNDAAYSAIKAARNDNDFGDKVALLNVARETDRLVDDNAKAEATQ
ncbi:hypothetical protein [Celeribacter naphthalenivorans]|uniref:hypothetical protein n=1 Tax=Celeribacter naphthalenivorans TaxID=1614694 RepID=UPI001CFB15AC|nr:hypothetical protein [Celeribacter naphthalenivorans]